MDYLAAIIMLINIFLFAYLVLSQGKRHKELVDELNKSRYEAKKWKYLYDMEKGEE